MKVNEEKELLERLQKAKSYAKKHKIRKSDFFQEAYGPMFYSDFNKLNNLWAGYTTDKVFVEKLDLYLQDKLSPPSVDVAFKKLQDFTDWYIKLGGRALTEVEIETVYDKLKQ